MYSCACGFKWKLKAFCGDIYLTILFLWNLKFLTVWMRDDGPFHYPIVRSALTVFFYWSGKFPVKSSCITHSDHKNPKLYLLPDTLSASQEKAELIGLTLPQKLFHQRRKPKSVWAFIKTSLLIGDWRNSVYAWTLDFEFLGPHSLFSTLCSGVPIIHPPMGVNRRIRGWERDSVCTLFLSPALHLRMWTKK